MRRVCWMLMAILVVGPAAASAQTVDAGRGELPVHVPSSYDAAAPAPLIVLLHGYTSSGAGQDTYMQVSALKDAYGFILVAPDGTREDGGNRPRFWNASDACCNFRGSTVDDVAYLAGLIDAVKAEYAVDDKRVYLFGHSNGGFMSYRMAHEHGGTIAAIASLAGADQSRPRPAPPEPVHVLQIHGTADTAIPYERGSFRDEAVPGARDSVESWAAHNGCAVTGVDSGTLDLDGGIDGPRATSRATPTAAGPAGLPSSGPSTAAGTCRRSPRTSPGSSSSGCWGIRSRETAVIRCGSGWQYRLAVPGRFLQAVDSQCAPVAQMDRAPGYEPVSGYAKTSMAPGFVGENAIPNGTPMDRKGLAGTETAGSTPA